MHSEAEHAGEVSEAERMKRSGKSAEERRNEPNRAPKLGSTKQPIEANQPKSGAGVRVRRLTSVRRDERKRSDERATESEEQSKARNFGAHNTTPTYLKIPNVTQSHKKNVAKRSFFEAKRSGAERSGAERS